MSPMLVLILGNLAFGAAPVSDKFTGLWRQTEECEAPASMKGDLRITGDKKKGIFKIEKPNVREAHKFNDGYVVKEKDAEGIEYQTTVETESFDGGKRLMVASIWKKTATTSGNNLAVILSMYELKSDDTLAFEKYGYTSYEENDQFQLKKYADIFPKNYRCIYKRAH